MPYIVYMIYSATSDVYYKGMTTHLKKRLRQHNEDEGRYTAGKGPWQLVYKRTFDSKTEALKHERLLKHQHRAYLRWLIGQEGNELESR